jgi:CRP-like cAMP-binding protein
MIQMMRLINRVKESSKGSVSMDFLVPYMTKENFKKGEIIFKKGDDADKVYYLRKGLARVMEFNAYIKDGELIGEIGIFSRDKKRTASIICETDCRFLSIPDKQILQLYYQNPTFGIYLVQLIIERFNMDTGKDDQMEKRPQHLTLEHDHAINFEKIPEQ